MIEWDLIRKSWLTNLSKSISAKFLDCLIEEISRIIMYNLWNFANFWGEVTCEKNRISIVMSMLIERTSTFLEAKAKACLPPFSFLYHSCVPQEMEAFRHRGGEISICDAIETKRYLFHIRHETLWRIQWRGDAVLPARTRLSIVDKSPCLTPVQISNKTRNRFPLAWDRNEIPRTRTCLRYFKCSHEKLSGQSGRIFAMEFGLNRTGRKAERRSTLEDVYEIFSGLCEPLWFGFLRKYVSSTCGYLQFLKRNVARELDFGRKKCTLVLT